MILLENNSSAMPTRCLCCAGVADVAFMPHIWPLDVLACAIFATLPEVNGRISILSVEF
jgi:hypothetical protein